MTRDELVAHLRKCGNVNNISRCYNCDLANESWNCDQLLMLEAADAIEALQQDCRDPNDTLKEEMK